MMPISSQPKILIKRLKYTDGKGRLRYEFAEVPLSKSLRKKRIGWTDATLKEKRKEERIRQTEVRPQRAPNRFTGKS